MQFCSNNLSPGTERLLPFVLRSFMDYDNMFRHFAVVHLHVVTICKNYFRGISVITKHSGLPNSKVRFFFTFMWPCIVTNFLIIKPTRCTNFSNLFWNESLHVSDSSSVHQEFFTVHTAVVYVIQVCRELSRSRISSHILILLLESCLQTCMTYTTAVCTVKNSWWTEELSETCRVSFQNKYEKLVHLVGFIIRIQSSYCFLRETYQVSVTK
jgi:hypothetical protein